MGERRILIVDDEPLIRDGLVRILNKKYTVKAVESGEEAIIEIGSCGYNLCFLDVCLPGMNGIDVMKKIQEISPNTRVAIMSAYVKSGSLKREIMDRAFAFIDKPFDILQIKDIARQALEREEDL